MLLVPLFLHHVATLFLSNRWNRRAHQRLPGPRDHLDHHPLHRTQQCNPMLRQQDDSKISRFLSKSARKHIFLIPIACKRTLILLSPCSFLYLFLKHLFGPGSYIQSAEKSFSMVKGGRTREAAALAWERQGPAPDRKSYKDWAKSVLENPAVVESKVKSNTTEMSSIQHQKKNKK